MSTVHSEANMLARLDSISRLNVKVRGVVQGVGFRPFVYQRACKHNLKGWVCNASGEVRIEVEGEQGELARFRDELEALAPPRSYIEGITVSRLPVHGYQGFEIRESIPEPGEYQLVSPDIATCPDCLAEVLTPGDRRYRYPFTNCTNCGPRFTIIEDIPYDREKTTMRQFQMCPECRREYDNPLDRRFHAQPNACPVCGPSLRLVDSNGSALAEGNELDESARLLREGKILAVKGLGGFLLACDANSDGAVRLLRERKKRPEKPLAVMLATLEDVKANCHVSQTEGTLLASAQCPIVLLKRKAESPISKLVSPRLKYLGVMLPYTPLHHVLVRETAHPLVMTSGNLSEEPIVKENEEALHKLKGIADYFLLHDRDIYARYDDSVAMVTEKKTQVIRRARGYAPYPVHLPFTARQVLAAGAELKNTFCLTRDEHAFISQHIGDMENVETLEHYQNTIELYKKLFRIQPEILAHDMHPDYLSTKYARELASRDTGLTTVPVQHHHAHIISCLTDNGALGPVIGVAFDGTGLGTDGCIWGGEFMMADGGGFRRLGHLQYAPLPGGEAAIERPYRMTLGYLITLLGKDVLQRKLAFTDHLDRNEIDIMLAQIERGINSPLTSSCGRLFDAVSALIMARDRVSYEAQAAIEMEMLADEGAAGSYPFHIEEANGLNIVKLEDLFAEIIHDLEKGTAPSVISMRFHRAVADIILRMCRILGRNTGIYKAALSGGVFQNRLLLRITEAALEGAGFEVLTHGRVPANDGGISLGQAVIASLSEGGDL